VIFWVGPHIDGRGHAVRHIVERCDGRDVPDVFLAEAGAAQSLAILLADGVAFPRQFDREIQHRAMARRELGGAIIHRHEIAQRRIAGELPHGGAVRGKAIEAAILGRHPDGDHLALQLRQARRREHQIVVEGGERFKLGIVDRVGAQHVRNEPDLVLALPEIGLHRLGEFALRQIERHGARRRLLPLWPLSRLRPPGAAILSRGFRLGAARRTGLRHGDVPP